MTVAVTGWACRTPGGDSPEALVETAIAGHPIVGPNARFSAETYACSLAAGVHTAPPNVHERILSPMARHAYGAALEAWQMAGAPTGPRVGLFAGIGGPRADWPVLMPALAKQNEALTDTWQNGFRRLHPFWMLQHLSNNAHALLSIEVGALGEGLMFGGANGGCQALAAAERALNAEAVDVAVVMAYDSLLEPEKLVPMAARGELFLGGAHQGGPYDQHARGAIPGEAAAALVLSRLENTGEPPLFSLTAEAAADGRRGRAGAEVLAGLARRLRRRAPTGALFIDGAGACVPEADELERAALADALGDDGLQLTTLAGCLGQVGAADGLVRAVAMGAALRAGRLYPIAGLTRPAPGPLRPLRTPTADIPAAGLALCGASPGLAGAVLVSRTAACL